MKTGAYYIEYNFTELSITTHDNILVLQEKLTNNQLTIVLMKTFTAKAKFCPYMIAFPMDQNFVAITHIVILSTTTSVIDAL